MTYALTGVVVGLLFVAGALYALLQESKAAARLTDARVDDLLNRLAARTYGEYAAFEALPEPAPEAERRLVYDPTGLIEADLDG